MPQVLLVSSNSDDAELFSSCEQYRLRFVFAGALMEQDSFIAKIADLLRESDAVVVDVGVNNLLLNVLEASAYSMDIPVLGFAPTGNVPDAIRENVVAVCKTQQEALVSLKLLIPVLGSAGPDYAEAVATIQATGI